MKTVFIFIIMTFSVNICLSQFSKDEFIEFRLDDGFGYFGFSSINFSIDGLLLRKQDPEEEISKFIPLSKINIKKMSRLLSFMKEIDVMNLEVINPEIDNHLFMSQPTRLAFVNSEREYRFYKYYYGDKRIDKLLMYLKSLLSKEDQKKYWIRKFEATPHTKRSLQPF